MNRRRAIWIVAVLVAFIVACIGGGCSGSSNSGGSSGVNLSGAGSCQGTCPKSCGTDQDCNTASGELCCDYGGGAKVCQAAKSCPRFCANDSNCETTTGEACVHNALGNSPTICEPSQAGLHFCSADGDCAANQVCCGIYNQSICTAANQCPKACGASSDCDTGRGEICCTSVGTTEPNLKTGGLCLNTAYEACPKACSTSADCSTNGQLCCNGICQATCPKACQQDSDCTGQICCRSPLQNVTPPPHLFKVSPSCGGTPSFTTCAQCGSSLGTCSRCPGCSADAGAGAYCSGSPTYTTCTQCGQAFGCSTSCQGCTSSLTCTGTPNPCSNYDANQAACQAELGCTYGTPTATSCSGTPALCSTFLSSGTCSAQSGCAWTSSCTGTLTTCSQLLDSLTCSNQRGCSWFVGSSTCAGTITPCNQLPTGGPDGGINPCTSVPGCTLQ